MATYYVAPGAPGSNSGTLANPWVSLQSAMNAVAAGDTVYFNTALYQAAGQTLTTAITEATTGTYALPIFIICTNAAWVEDGTYGTLNGNSAAGNCYIYSKSYYIIRNLECKGSTSHGVTYSGTPTYTRVFTNCYLHNNGGHGVSCYGSRELWTKCTFANNTASGCVYGIYKLCISYSNVTGFNAVAAINNCSLFGCIGYDNTTQGASAYPELPIDINNCVFNNCVIGINVGITGGFIHGNRLTNNSTAGIQGTTLSSYGILIEDWNFFLGNGTPISITSGLYSPGNSISAGTEGYTNKTGKVFNMTDTATGRRIMTRVGGW